jgi:hypothetical protein
MEADPVLFIEWIGEHLGDDFQTWYVARKKAKKVTKQDEKAASKHYREQYRAWQADENHVFTDFQPLEDLLDG